jgi:WD40 repeat protein
MGRIVLALAGMCIGLLGIFTPVGADEALASQEARTYLEARLDGSYLMQSPGPGEAPAQVPQAGFQAAGFRDGEVLWHNYLTDATYQSAAISMTTGRVVAGTWLNPPKETELIPLEGDGTPDWVFPGTDFRVGAARNGDVIASVDKVGTGVMLYKWHTGSATPDWSYEIPSCSVGGARALVVSQDASTIALVVTMQDPQFVRLYCFDPASSTPFAMCDGPANGFARNVDVTPDGRYVAFISAADAYVYDCDTQAVRWSGSMGASNDPLAISGDGNYIAYGWTSLYVKQWNGSAYVLLWTSPGGSYWVGPCRFSGDASTLVVGWYDHSSYLQNRIQLFEMPSQTPLWTRLYTLGSGTYQDIPAVIEMTADGSHLVVGSWGDTGNTNPEVQIYEHDSPDPIYTVDTPGSVFDADIAKAGSYVYVVAGAKHVHANQQGRGGDLYSIRVSIGSAAVEETLLSGPLALEIGPNPCLMETAIRCTLPQAADAHVQVYDPAGRLIRVLHEGPLGAGTHSMAWDGTSGNGSRTEPGIYFLRLAAGGQSICRQIILTR